MGNPYEESIKLIEWCIAALAGGGLGVFVMNATFEREIEVWQGAGGVVVALLLTVLAVSTAGSDWYFASLGLMALVVAVAYALRAAGSHVGAEQLLEEDAAKYREAIEFDFKNAAAHAFLGRVLRKQGRLKEALTEYEIAVELDPQDYESRHRIKGLIEEMRAQPPPPSCPRCEAELDESGKTCTECDWSRSTVKGLRDIKAGGVLKRAVLYTLAVNGGIVIAKLALHKDPETMLVLMLVAWALCGLALLRWLVKDVW